MILKVSLVFDPSIQIVYTDAWMYDPKIQDYLEAAVTLLLKMLRDQFDGNADRLRNIEIGIHLVEIQAKNDKRFKRWLGKGGKTEIKACYHLCDMEAKEVFWLHDVDAHIFWEDLDHRIIGPDHLRKHTQLFLWCSIILVFI